MKRIEDEYTGSTLDTATVLYITTDDPNFFDEISAVFRSEAWAINSSVVCIGTRNLFNRESDSSEVKHIANVVREAKFEGDVIFELG